jgi:hypothetical protein
MTLQGQVYDIVTNEPVPNASLTIVNAAGSPLNGGAVADGNGVFSLTSSLLDSGGKVLVSSVGYSSVIADPAVIASTNAIGLSESATGLPTATVTARAPVISAASTKYLPYVLGGGALVLMLWPGEKKKKAVGDLGGFDYTKLAITGGILVGGYFAGKAILQKLGIISTPDPVTSATTDAQKTSLAQAQAAAKQTGSGAASYTADQYTGFANDIFNIANAEYSLPLSVTAQNSIVNDLTNMNNMVDLQLLISAFGVRASNCGIFGLGCTNYDLPSFLKAALDGFHIATIDQYLSAQNINYQF